MKLFYCRHIKRIPCSALDPSYFVLSVSCLWKKSLRARQLDNTTEGLIARGCYLCKQKPTLLKKKKKKKLNDVKGSKLRLTCSKWTWAVTKQNNPWKKVQTTALTVNTPNKIQGSVERSFEFHFCKFYTLPRMISIIHKIPFFHLKLRACLISYSTPRDNTKSPKTDTTGNSSWADSSGLLYQPWKYARIVTVG